jgi:hypothetical protein
MSPGHEHVQVKIVYYLITLGAIHYTTSYAALCSYEGMHGIPLCSTSKAANLDSLKA